MEDLLGAAKDTVEPTHPTRSNSALPHEMAANKVREIGAKNMGELSLEQQEEPNVYVEDDEDEAFN